MTKNTKKNEIKPTEVTVGSHKKVIWKCRLGHEWTASVKSRSINGSGCPYCSHNKVLVGFNDLATVVPKVADEWSEKNEKKPTEVTAFANRKGGSAGIAIMNGIHLFLYAQAEASALVAVAIPL